MTNNDLKKLLKNKADGVEVKSLEKEIISKTHHIPCEEKTEKKRVSYKWLYPVGAALVTACLVLALIPLGLFGGSGSGLVAGSAEEIFSDEMLALGNALTMSDEESAVSGGLIPLSSMYGNKKIVFLDNDYYGFNDEDYRRIAEDVNYYLLTANALIASEGIKVDYGENGDGIYSSYKYKMSVSYEDERAFSVGYIAYYSESEAVGGISEISGVFITDGVEYPLSGRKESRGGEVEIELRIATGESSYISVSNEIEKGENEYEYRYYENGVLVRGVAIDASVEGRETAIEIEISENGKTVSYEFEFVGRRIECEYEADGREAEIDIRIEDERYLYIFENGYRVELDKH